MSAIEAKVAAQSSAPLPAPEPPVVEDRRLGELSEIFTPAYRGRTIMLSVANFFQTIGFYGFANRVPTLLIAKGIHVSQTLEYSFIIAFAYPLFPLVSTLFADRIERKWQVCLSCIGIAVFGIVFSLQTAALPLIIIGTLQTMMNAWLSFSAHNYQPELFSARVRSGSSIPGAGSARSSLASSSPRSCSTLACQGFLCLSPAPWQSLCYRLICLDRARTAVRLRRYRGRCPIEANSYCVTTGRASTQARVGPVTRVLRPDAAKSRAAGPGHMGIMIRSR
jgi:hypothetical protein